MSDIGEGSQVWHQNNTILLLERELADVTAERDALQADKNRLLEAAELGLEYIGGSLVQEKISLAFKAAIDAAKGVSDE